MKKVAITIVMDVADEAAFRAHVRNNLERYNLADYEADSLEYAVQAVVAPGGSVPGLLWGDWDSVAFDAPRDKSTTHLATLARQYLASEGLVEDPDGDDDFEECAVVERATRKVVKRGFASESVAAQWVRDACLTGELPGTPSQYTTDPVV